MPGDRDRGVGRWCRPRGRVQRGPVGGFPTVHDPCGPYGGRVVSPGSSMPKALRELPWPRIGGWLRRGAAVYLTAALLVAPLAIGWAIAHTHAEEQVGITPTTFRLSTSGHSELRLGIAGTVFLPRHL